MRQSYRIIPVYTADVSGVCSALYELGGMVVMHDPSGCNSTYNTHDEIRWYEQDSLIYISGLTEIDAVMGNDAKFIRDIEETARELQPKFIALAGSPIPFMNGTDFPAIAQVIETETGIPAFAIPTNGMHDYTYGAGLALAKIAERFVQPVGAAKVTGATRTDISDVTSTGRSSHTLNLLGVTPLDFGPQQNIDHMKQILAKHGWQVTSIWAMGDSLENLSHAAEAEVNLVVSSVGLETAKILKEKFGTPYVIGTPVGDFTEDLVMALEQVTNNTNKKKKSSEEESTSGGQDEPEILYLRNRLSTSPEITLIGEAVTMGSLAAAIEKKYEKAVRVLCPLETNAGLLAPADHITKGEEEAENYLKDAKIIVADPLYRPICPSHSQFYDLPHIAFSGRIYLKRYKDILTNTTYLL